ncbi:hypothetical protein TNCV_2325571 [Trichonephila clavipes]|nr:hypothetical protein TNCV_2325571 [Trichonephila clavipes]
MDHLPESDDALVEASKTLLPCSSHSTSLACPLDLGVLLRGSDVTSTQMAGQPEIDSKFKEVHGHSSERPSCPQSRPATLLESFSFYLRNDPITKHNPFRPRPSIRGIKKRLPPDDLSSSHPFWRWDTLLAIVPTGFCNTHGWRRELNIRCVLLFLLRKLKGAFGKSVDTLQLQSDKVVSI